MTEVKNLTNFAIQSTSDTEDVQTHDYDSSAAGGWAASIVTGNSYTVDCTLNIDMPDPLFDPQLAALIQQLALQSSETANHLAPFRQGLVTRVCQSRPLNPRCVVYVTNFSEDIQAGNVAVVTFTPRIKATSGPKLLLLR